MAGDIHTTLDERGKTHGDYSVHAQVTQDIKHAIFAGRVAAVHGAEPDVLPAWMQETIDMIAHKLGRIAAGNPDFRDHWHDIAGYATLAADRCSDAEPVTIPKEMNEYKGMYTYQHRADYEQLGRMFEWVIFDPEGNAIDSENTMQNAINNVKHCNER